MSKFFIIGERGRDSVWVVDTQNKSVREVDPGGARDDDATDAEFVKTANAMRRNGMILSQGIDLAVASEAASDAASHRLTT